MMGEEGESEINRMKGNVKKGNDVVCVCEQIGADAEHIISYFHITFNPIDLRFTLCSCN